MSITPRQHDIVAQARRDGVVSVEALAARFAVTPQTIRRDINVLCDADLLRRRHGGAEIVEGPRNASYDDRRVTRLAAKRRIGAAAARLVPNHASVLIGIGTTPEMVARALVGHEDLTVVTNSLAVAMTLSAGRSNRIFLPGGAVRLPDRDLVGPEAEALFRSYRADFGIFGVGGIEPDGALVEFDRAEVAARQAIRESCRRAILVADLSKFRRPAPAHGGRLADADVVVLNGPPDAEFAALIDAAAVDLVVAGPPPAAAGDADRPLSRPVAAAAPDRAAGSA